MNYQDRPLVQVTAVLYGETTRKPITLTDPTVIPNGGGLRYTVDLSRFGIAGMVHIRIDDMPKIEHRPV